MIHFCQKCFTLLETKKQGDNIVLKCSNCDYFETIEATHIIHSKNYKEERSKVSIPSSTIYDVAVRRTTKVKCLNESCPSLKPENWGSRTSTGFVVEPNVMISTVYDSDRVCTYICRICGQAFRPT
jgi:DNA-directed RNA polymerase subunit M/transcription elongation factor TFIIS